MPDSSDPPSRLVPPRQSSPVRRPHTTAVPVARCDVPPSLFATTAKTVAAADATAKTAVTSATVRTTGVEVPTIGAAPAAAKKFSGGVRPAERIASLHHVQRQLLARFRRSQATANRNRPGTMALPPPLLPPSVDTWELHTEPVSPGEALLGPEADAAHALAAAEELAAEQLDAESTAAATAQDADGAATNGVAATAVRGKGEMLTAERMVFDGPGARTAGVPGANGCFPSAPPARVVRRQGGGGGNGGASFGRGSSDTGESSSSIGGGSSIRRTRQATMPRPFTFRLAARRAAQMHPADRVASALSQQRALPRRRRRRQQQQHQQQQQQQQQQLTVAAQYDCDGRLLLLPSDRTRKRGWRAWKREASHIPNVDGRFASVTDVGAIEAESREAESAAAAALAQVILQCNPPVAPYAAPSLTLHRVVTPPSSKMAEATVAVVPGATQLEEAERKWADLIDLSNAQAARVAKMLAAGAQANETEAVVAKRCTSSSSGNKCADNGGSGHSSDGGDEEECASPPKNFVIPIQRDIQNATASAGQPRGDDDDDAKGLAGDDSDNSGEYDDEQFDDEEYLATEEPCDGDAPVPAWAAGPTSRAVASATRDPSVSFSERSIVSLEADIEDLLAGGRCAKESPAAETSTSSLDMMEQLERDLEAQIAAAVTPKRTRAARQASVFGATGAPQAVAKFALDETPAVHVTEDSVSNNSSSQLMLSGIESDIHSMMQRGATEDVDKD